MIPKEKTIFFQKSRAMAYFMIGGLVLGAILAFYLKTQKDAGIELIKASPAHTKGIVVAKPTNKKTQSLMVDYSVAGYTHRLKTQVSPELFDRFMIGDSIAVVYASNAPENAMLDENGGLSFK